MRKGMTTIRWAVLTLMGLWAIGQQAFVPLWADMPASAKPWRKAHKASPKIHQTPPPGYFIEENSLHHPELPTPDTVVPEEPQNPAPEASPNNPSGASPSAQQVPHS